MLKHERGALQSSNLNDQRLNYYSKPAQMVQQLHSSHSSNNVPKVEQKLIHQPVAQHVEPVASIVHKSSSDPSVGHNSAAMLNQHRQQ